MIGSIRVYTDNWVRKHYCVTPDSDMSSTFFGTITKARHMALNEYWYRKAVSDTPRRVSNIFVANDAEGEEYDLLGKPTVFISNEG